MKMIYLASPYSHNNKMIEYQRYWKITQVAASLHSTYKHAFILPITQSKILCDIKPELGGSFEKWAERDLEFILRCDEVWVVKMEGWKESVGVQAEIRFAKDIEKVIRYVHPTTLKVVKNDKK